MDPRQDSATLNEFLHCFLDDRDRGTLRTVDEYCAMFPRAAEAIIDQFGRRSAESSEPQPPPSIAGVDGAEMVLASEGDIGHYRLLRRLGRGSFGLVYLALDLRLARSVALKLLARSGFESERERALFAREAEIASRLDHPGICPIYDIGRHGIWTWIAMRHVPGETLAVRLAADGQLPSVREVATLIERVARALHAAHQRGVIHRDVKPGNIMVTPEGDPVVVDFGLARDPSGAEPVLTVSGEMVGTPAYMSPEQVLGVPGGVDRRTDVWSLGVTLYESLALARPFDAPTQAGLFRAITESEPPPPARGGRRVMPDLAVIVATAISKDRARRYQTAEAMADDLSRFLAGQPVLARPIGIAARLVRWGHRNPVVASLVAIIVLLLTSGFVVTVTLLGDARKNLQDWERLADGRKLEDLERRQREDLFPAVPSKVPLMERWLADARALAARLPDHRRALDALRARARPLSEAGRTRDAAHAEQSRAELAKVNAEMELLTARRRTLADDYASTETRQTAHDLMTARLGILGRRRALLSAAVAARTVYEFDDDRDQLQHDKLAELVAGLDQLAHGTASAPSRIELTEARAASARTLRARTVDAYADSWRAAIERVGHAACYRGLRLVPQPGLSPIGADPESMLEEFADDTAGEIPRRDARGHITLTEQSAIVFVLLPGGSALLGAQAADRQGLHHDPDARADEQPVNTLELAPFFMGKFELTQGQWLRWMDAFPSTYGPGSRMDSTVVDLRHPVESVSWDECDFALRWYGLVLPTEAQWEYACRAGTSTPWPCAQDRLPAAANLADATFRRGAGASGWATEPWDDGWYIHAPVGSFPSNASGLHDMLGNVAEWCADPYGSYESRGREGDGQRSQAQTRVRVMRGGGWMSVASFARSAARMRFDASTRSLNAGVRAARPMVNAQDQ